MSTPLTAAPPRLVSIREATQTLSLGRTKLHELLTTKAIRSCKIGRRRLIELASLQQYATSLLEANAATTAPTERG